MRKFISLFIVAVLAVFVVEMSEARMWTNKQGKKVNAHYLTSDEKTITLILDKDSREVVVAKDMFSEEDIKYVEEQEVALTVPAYEELGPDLKKKAKASSGGEWKRGI